jgi:hypothetical protein
MFFPPSVVQVIVEFPRLWHLKTGFACLYSNVAALIHLQNGG